MANPKPDPENLTPWPPGVSGNPAGYSRARRMMAALHKLCDEEGNYDRFVSAAWEAALSGNFSFWHYLFELIAPPETSADGLAAAKLKALEAAHAGCEQHADSSKSQ
jgi:hypothetical protein